MLSKEQNAPGSQVLEAIDAAHARVGAEQRGLLRLVAQVEREQLWRGDGARDTAHWLAMRYGISLYKALRWVGAAHALEQLPEVGEALASGVLGLDVVVELTRLATPHSESELIEWSQTVNCAAIRRRADLAARAKIHEVLDAEASRFVSWWYCDDGARFGLAAELPAAQGAIVARALQRVAESIPKMPDEQAADRFTLDARRADALVALCSARIGADPDPDRATVVVHAQLDGLVGGSGGCEIEDGPVIHPETARRLLCNARVQTVLEDPSGTVVAMGRMRREPSAAMVRQVRYRDRGCRFPGCGARRFTQAHHIVFWADKGPTDLDNLLLICSFHHRLVHEHRWSVHREHDGTVQWLRPSGVRYRAGPSPGTLGGVTRNTAAQPNKNGKIEDLHRVS